MADKKEMDVLKILRRYFLFEQVVNKPSAQKILKKNGSGAGKTAIDDRAVLQVMQDYIATLNNVIITDSKGNDSMFGVYIGKLEREYKKLPENQRLQKAGPFDTGFNAYMEALLALDDNGASVAAAIEKNPDVAEKIKKLPITLGGKKQDSYVEVLAQYIDIFTSMSGLKGELTELHNAHAKNKARLENLPVIREQFETLKKVDAVHAENFKTLNATLETMKGDLGKINLEVIQDLQDKTRDEFDNVTTLISVEGEAIRQTIATENAATQGVVKKDGEKTRKVVAQQGGQTRAAVQGAEQRIVESVYETAGTSLEVNDDLAKKQRKATHQTSGQLRSEVRGAEQTIKETIYEVEGTLLGDNAYQHEETRRVIREEAGKTTAAAAAVATEVAAGVKVVNDHTTREADRVIEAVNAVNQQLVANQQTTNNANTATKKGLSKGFIAAGIGFSLALIIAAGGAGFAIGNRNSKGSSDNSNAASYDNAAYQMYVQETDELNSYTDLYNKLVVDGVTIAELQELAGARDNAKASDKEGYYSSTTTIESMYNSAATMNELASKVIDLESQVTTLNVNIGNLESQVAGLETQQQADAAKIAELNTLVESYKTELANKETELAAAKAEIESLKQQLANAGTDAEKEALKAEIATLTTKLANAEANLEVANEKLAQAEKTIVELNEKVSGLETELATANAQIEQLKADGAIDKAKIAELEGKLSQSAAKVAELEQKLANAPTAEEKAALEAELKTAKEELAASKDEVAKYVKLNEELKAQLEEALNKAEEAETKAAELETELAKAKQDNELKAAELAELVIKYDTAVSTYNELLAKYNELLQSNVSSETLEQAYAKIEALQTELSGTQAELAAALQEGASNSQFLDEFYQEITLETSGTMTDAQIRAYLADAFGLDYTEKTNGSENNYPQKG